MVVHPEVAHPVSDRTQPCLTSVKLMELTGPLGHSPYMTQINSLPKQSFVENLHTQELIRNKEFSQNERIYGVYAP